MKKELQDAMKTLDVLNLELENIKVALINNNPIISNNIHNSNHDLESVLKILKDENDFLKQQLSEHKDFINNILENIEEVFMAIKELRNDE